MATVRNQAVTKITLDTVVAQRRAKAFTASMKQMKVSVDGVGASLQTAFAPLDGLQATFQTTTKSSQSIGRALAKIARDAPKVSSGAQDIAQGFSAINKQSVALVASLDKANPLLKEVARLSRALARAQQGSKGGAAGAAAPDPAKVRQSTGALDGLAASARRVAVDSAAANRHLVGLGRAMDDATDPVNELKNGIDGVSDQLAIFGRAGVSTRNVVEDLIDPDLRLAQANIEVARSQKLVNHPFNKFRDNLTVARLNLAQYAGGIENLNMLMGGAALAVGALTAAFAKLAKMVVDGVIKAYDEYAKTQPIIIRNQEIQKAQLEALTVETGHLADDVLGLTEAEYGQQRATALLTDALEVYREELRQSSRAVQLFEEFVVNAFTSLDKLAIPILTLVRALKEFEGQQKQTNNAIISTTDSIIAQTRAYQDLADAMKKAGVTVAKDYIKQANDAKKEGDRLAREEIERGREAYAMKIRDANIARQEASKNRQSRKESSQDVQSTILDMFSVASGFEKMELNISASLERITDRTTNALGGAAQDIAKQINTIQTEAIQADKNPFYAAIEGAMDFKRALVDVSITGVQGLARLTAGQGSWGEIFKGALASLSAYAIQLGSFLILAGSGLGVIPGFQASAAAVPVGYALVAGGALGAFAAAGGFGGGGSSGSGGAGGGSATQGGFSSTTTDFGPRPEAQGPSVTKIVLQLDRQVLGEVVTEEVDNAAALGRLLNIPVRA